MSIIDRIGERFSSVQNALSKEYHANRALQRNKDLASYQFDLELEQWNRANEYNSPYQQMQRYKQAGLNPNLIYGQANEAESSAPSASASFSYDTSVNPLQVAQVALDGYTKYRTMSMMQEKQQAEIDSINQSTRNAELQEQLELLNYKKELIESGYYEDNARYNSEARKLANDEITATIDNLISQTELNSVQAFYTDEMAQKVHAERETIQQQLDYLREDRNLSQREKQAQVMMLETELKYLDNYLKYRNLKSGADAFVTAKTAKSNITITKEQAEEAKYYADLIQQEVKHLKSESASKVISVIMQLLRALGGGRPLRR